jgi:hypothetical protein
MGCALSRCSRTQCRSQLDLTPTTYTLGHPSVTPSVVARGYHKGRHTSARVHEPVGIGGREEAGVEDAGVDNDDGDDGGEVSRMERDTR